MRRIKRTSPTEREIGGRFTGCDGTAPGWCMHHFFPGAGQPFHACRPTPPRLGVRNEEAADRCCPALSPSTFFAGRKSTVGRFIGCITRTMSTTFKATVSVLALACSLRAAPVAYEEVSLLVRMHEADRFISEQASQRGLLHKLTPQQEARLKAQGASDVLIQELRNPDLLLPDSEAAACETARREQASKAIQEAAAAPAATQATNVPPADFPVADAPFEGGYYNYPAGYFPYGYGRLRSRAHGFGRTALTSRKSGVSAKSSARR